MDGEGSSRLVIQADEPPPLPVRDLAAVPDKAPRRFRRRRKGQPYHPDDWCGVEGGYMDRSSSPVLWWLAAQVARREART